MKQREQARIQVLNTVLEQHLSIAQAAEIMEFSERHTKRLLAAYRREGPAALSHGNRGRRPHNAVPEAAAAAVVKLASDVYAGANHSHFTELLREREGIDLSRPTVRRILVKAGLGSPRSRRSQQHRFRRKRMPREGMLTQVDGSPHAWLEERADKFVLLLAVDDATGTVAQAVFHYTEDTRGYLILLEGLVRQWGIPLALYSDRHAAFKYNARQGPVLYESTQFARVMRELGIQQIFAMSPQAKGRVERMASPPSRTGWSPSCAWLALATMEAGQCRPAGISAPLQPAVRRGGGAAGDGLPAGAGGLVPHRDGQHQAYPKGGPGQHGEVPLAGPATAAWQGTALLCRSPGGTPGTGRRGADAPVPGGAN